MISTNFIAEFNTQKILEVLVKYEGLKTYTFTTSAQALYLAYFCDESESDQTWLYIPTNETRLSRLIRDEESILSFVRNSSLVFQVTTDFSRKVTQVNRVYPEDVDTTLLPAEGVFLEVPVSDFTIKIEKVGISPGTVDADFRDSVKVIIENRSDNESYTIKQGDRIAQGIICPVNRVSFAIIDELDESERGTAGFGSTGNA
jgi:hypothetical protein